MMTADSARRVVSNIAKLPELVPAPDHWVATATRILWAEPSHEQLTRDPDPRTQFHLSRAGSLATMLEMG